MKSKELAVRTKRDPQVTPAYRQAFYAADTTLRSFLDSADYEAMRKAAYEKQREFARRLLEEAGEA